MDREITFIDPYKHPKRVTAKPVMPFKHYLKHMLCRDMDSISFEKLLPQKMVSQSAFFVVSAGKDAPFDITLNPKPLNPKPFRQSFGSPLVDAGQVSPCYVPRPCRIPGGSGQKSCYPSVARSSLTSSERRYSRR